MINYGQQEPKRSENNMAYRFSAIQKAAARVYRPDTTDSFKLAGVNGQQTNAGNFHTAITGLLTVVGLTQQKLERDITQEVEDAP